MATPNTFSDKTGQIALTLLDENFEYIDSSLTTLQSDINTVQSNLDNIDLTDIQGNTTITGTLNVTGTISLGGNWTIVETNGTLYFKNSGVSKVKITSDGAITSVDDIIAVGTM